MLERRVAKVREKVNLAKLESWVAEVRENVGFLSGIFSPDRDDF